MVQTQHPPTYKYVVRIINPQRKSDYKVRIWHNIHEKFTSPEAIKEKLRDTFTENVPDNLEFEIGYFEKPGNSKRWIETVDDVEAMYTVATKVMIPIPCGVMAVRRGAAVGNC